MSKEVRPVQRAQAEGRNACGGSPGQRQVADVGKDQVGLEAGQKSGLIGNTARPVGVGLAIGDGAGFEVDAGGVDHRVAEVAGFGDQCVGWLDPLLQLGGR